jgi:hypothetical protein
MTLESDFSVGDCPTTISLEHTRQVGLTRDLDVIMSLVNVDTIETDEDSL